MRQKKLGRQKIPKTKPSRAARLTQDGGYFWSKRENECCLGWRRASPLRCLVFGFLNLKTSSVTKPRRGINERGWGWGKGCIRVTGWPPRAPLFTYGGADLQKITDLFRVKRKNTHTRAHGSAEAQITSDETRARFPLSRLPSAEASLSVTSNAPSLPLPFLPSPLR